MQHKFLKTNTYYSFIYNLPFILVFTNFVDILCLFECFSLIKARKMFPQITGLVLNNKACFKLLAFYIIKFLAVNV